MSPAPRYKSGAAEPWLEFFCNMKAFLVLCSALATLSSGALGQEPVAPSKEGKPAVPFIGDTFHSISVELFEVPPMPPKSDSRTQLYWTAAPVMLRLKRDPETFCAMTEQLIRTQGCDSVLFDLKTHSLTLDSGIFHSGMRCQHHQIVGVLQGRVPKASS